MMVKRIWCFIWGHDWKGISVKEVNMRAGAYAVISLMECHRCRAWCERSKRIDPLEKIREGK
jgi:hypothetical protein